MTVKLAFEKRFRQRSAVDYNECRRPACTIRVNGTGHQLFSGPAFTDDQYRRFDSGDLGNLFIYLYHFWRCTDDVGIRHRVCEFGTDGRIPHELELLFDAMENANHVIDHERLADVIEGAIMNSVDCRFHRPVSSHD